MSGERRSFGLNASRNVVHVPYPPPVPGWTLRTMTSGVALQCSPSKDRTARYPLHELSPRELGALTIVEGGVALGWIAASWPGLMPELRRVLPDLEIVDPELDGQAMLERALSLAHSTNIGCGALPSWACCRWPFQRIADSPAPPGGCTGGCRGRPGVRTRIGRCRFPSGETAASGTRTCRRRAGPRTRTSRFARTSARASPIPSGTPGRTVSSRIMSRFWSESTRPLAGRWFPSRPMCGDGSKSTRIVP